MATKVIIETMPPTAVGRSALAGPDPVKAEDDFRFHALLFPNRSLSPDGFKRVLAVVIGVNLMNGLIYFTLGAWPVAFFCGLDILIVWAAFQVSYAQGRRHERVMLTDDALWVSRVLPSGHETRWKLSPYWTKVDVDDPVEHTTQLKLIEKGKTLVVGSFLAPQERKELGDAIRNALRELRAAST